jgi:hypothetical protein
MNSKLVIFIFIHGLFLFSCKADTGFKTIIIDPNSTEIISFNDIYELSKTIQLETSDSAMIGEVCTVLKNEDKIYVLSGKRHSRFFYTVFDTLGNFLYRQDRRGRGPGEYIKIGGLFVNGDSVIICSSDKFVYYNSSGEFIKEREVNAGMFIGMDYLISGEFIANYGMSMPDSTDGRYYSIKLYSSQGEYLNGFLPIPADVAGRPYFSPTSSLIITKDGSSYFYPYTHTSIFRYSHDSKIFSELFRFKIRGEPEFDIYEISPALVENSKWLFNKNILWLFDIGKDFILLRLNSNNRILDAFADLSTNKIFLIPKDKFYDHENKIPINPKENNLGTLISVVEKEDSNAVIAIYKRKILNSQERYSKEKVNSKLAK